MHTRKTEDHHHSAEQVVGYFTAALECVEKADLPPELHEAAFAQAVGLLAAKQIFYEQAVPLGATLLGKQGH